MKDKFKSILASVGYFILALGIQLTISLISGIVLGIIYALKNPNEATTNSNEITYFILQYTNYILLISSIITVLVLMFIYSLKKRNIKNELLILRTKNSNLLIAILLGVSVWIFNVGALGLIEMSGFFQSAFDTFSQTTSIITQGSFFSSVLVVGIIVPFAEEFLFRGVIYRTLNRNLSIPLSIIIQALLFGVFHGNLIQGTYATLLGIIFGYITYKCNSLWPAYIAHMTNNLVALTIPQLLPSSLATILGYSAFTILGVLLIVISILLINKNSFKDNNSLNIT